MYVYVYSNLNVQGVLLGTEIYLILVDFYFPNLICDFFFFLRNYVNYIFDQVLIYMIYSCMYICI